MSLVEKAIKRLAEAKGQQRPAGREHSAAPPYEPRGGAAVPEHRREREDTESSNALRPRRDIDFASLRASGMLAAEHERKAFSKVFRGIKRPLLDRAAQRDGGGPESARANVVMVTSAVPGDGKTFTAINLALSLALERDKHVVLIDGDVVKRELSRRLGFGLEAGLIEFLEDAALTVNDVVIQTELPNLSVLPAGHTSAHATELLSSTRMHALVEQFSRSRDCLVIFDSPPLLLTTESQAIAQMAGQAVLVVREGHTSKDMMTRALPLLKSCPSVSLVLNQSLSPLNSGYGYEDGGKAPFPGR